ncbi:Berberine bridge enzyme-like 8 [Linum grandiflorum]
MDETTAFLSSLANNSDPAHPISAAVYTTDHPSYSSALNAYIHNLRFTTASTPKPFLILTASHISHVQAAVISAAAHPAVHMKIRSGGHDYEGTSYSSSSDRSPFFILDMCNLRNIDVDIRSETAWVECGATLGEFFHAIAEKSPTHAFPAGVCPTVGVGGHFVGGGYGNLMRKYGLSIDNIVDARMVDAKGNVLDRQSMGEDLFWAIRGGGASFGVVLSYKVNLVRVPEVVTVFRVRRTLEENATEIVYTWQKVAPTLVVDVLTDNIKAKTVRGTFIGMFLGRSERLLSIMRETFPELGLTTSDCVETSWINTVAFWADKPAVTKTRAEINRGGLPNNLLHLKRKSDYVERPIPKDGLEKIWRKMMEVGVVKMGFNPYGGRMSEISPEATPFPHRAGNLWKIQYQTNWTEGGKEAERRHLELSREMYGFMTPYVSSCPRGAFFNYKDLDLGVINNNGGGYEEGKRYGLSYFKGNFDKLVRIKSEVDPGNLFRHEQSVPVLARRPKL